VHRIHRVLYAALLVGILVLAAPIAVEAAGPQTLSGVIDSLRLWVVGLLAGLATLFLTIGGIRYMTAGGDPGQIERAKSALRSAPIGYALAALSPVLVAILQSIVGS
jgi:Type IV secretion system pilin